MVKYYAALGKFELHGNVPIVISGGDEHRLCLSEFVLWTSLARNIFNKDSLESEFYRCLHINRIYDDISFEKTLNRLEVRGLIASGEDYLAAGALYNLLKDLNVLPVGSISIVKRYILFVYFRFIKRVSKDKCRRYLKKRNFSELDKKIITFAKKTDITVAELIKIYENNLWNIKGADEIIDNLYADGDDSKSIENKSFFSKCRNDILTTVVNLYFNGQLNFDKV